MNTTMPGLREGPRLRVLHFLLCCLFSMSACDYTNANPNIEISKDFMEISPLRTYTSVSSGCSYTVRRGSEAYAIYIIFDRSF